MTIEERVVFGQLSDSAKTDRVEETRVIISAATIPSSRQNAAFLSRQMSESNHVRSVGRSRVDQIPRFLHSHEHREVVIQTRLRSAFARIIHLVTVSFRVVVAAIAPALAAKSTLLRDSAVENAPALAATLPFSRAVHARSARNFTHSRAAPLLPYIAHLI